MNINSPGSRLREASLPPLIQYKDLQTYIPAYGDFIIWTGIITTWCGIVTNYDKTSNSLSVIYNGVPFVLFTLSPEEQIKETQTVKLEDLKNAPKGKYAIQQRDHTNNTTIWYI